MGWIFHTRPNKDQSFPILYQFYYDGKKFTISSGIATKKGNFKNGRIKSDPLANIRLSKIEDAINSTLTEAKKAFPRWTEQYVKVTIRARIDGTETATGTIRHRLYDYWETRLTHYRKSNMLDMLDHSTLSRKNIFKHLDQSIYLDEIKLSHLNHIKDNLLITYSPTSVNGYFRDLKAVMNRALADDLIITTPFKNFKMPKMQKRDNIALTWDEFQAFRDAKLPTFYMNLVRDMAVFRYYCLGMRIKDQLLLKSSNIKSNILTYQTSKNTKRFSFELLPEAIEIIQRYKSKHPFLFPILKKGTRDEIREATQRMNKALTRIAKHAGIEKKISTHSFRHTFASLNKDLGAMNLKDALGHSSFTTTENYLQSISTHDDIVRKVKK